MVKVGERCMTCRFWGLQTQSCDYCLIMKKSRTVTNGVQIANGYCDKFEEGKRIIDPNEWIKEEFKVRKARRKQKRKEI